jgi:opacity protein-like surface antigen
MKNFLLLAGVVSLMISSPAQAERYYRGDDGYYYVEQPRVSQPKVQYIEEGEYYERETPRYSEPKYTRSSTRYQRVNEEDARQYQEKQAYKEDYSVNKVRPYIGFDIGRTYAKLTDTDDEDLFKDKNNSISGVIGLKFNKNFGLEAFYQQSDKAKKSVDYGIAQMSTSLQYSAYGADFLGYLPVSQDFEVLASLGLAQYDLKAKASGHLYGIPFSEKDSEDSLGYRFGLGLQYNINQHLALRTMAHYIQLDKDEDIKHLTEISLGLRYMF